jgi:hypothetical protein
MIGPAPSVSSHEYRNPGCYIDAFDHDHGLARSQQQIERLAEKKAAWKAEAKAEDLRARYEFLLDWMGVAGEPVTSSIAPSLAILVDGRPPFGQWQPAPGRCIKGLAGR